MLDIRFNSIHAKAACFLLLICFVVGGAAVFTTRKVEAIRSTAVNSANKFPTDLPTNAKANGKIVFSSDRNSHGTGFNLWTMDGDGSNLSQLTTLPTGPNAPSYAYDFNAKYSPDGKKIAFQSYGRRDGGSYVIFVMNTDGSDLGPISISSIPEIGRFEWSPDGTKFLFEAGAYGCLFGASGLRIKLSNHIETCPTANIFIVDTDGKNTIRLTKDDALNAFASWSPDGKQIAFMSNREGGQKIFLMNADGSNQHAITSAGSYGSPSWSPDGSKLLIVGPGTLNCHNGGCNELYTINPTGTELKQLTHYSDDYESPRYSPDGTQILFDRHLATHYTIEDPPYGGYINSDDGYAIFVMEADGGGQTNITNHFAKASESDFGYNTSPAWQPLSSPAYDPPPAILSLSSNLYSVPNSASPKTEIIVTRTGNVNEAVSCDYQIPRNGEMLQGSPQGTLSFASGERSKTIVYPGSAYSGDTVYVHLSDVIGNGTFVGGIKDALISPISSSVIDNTDYFVRQQYEDFLNRDPDPLGWRFWNINIYTCGGNTCRTERRAQVSAAFFLSIEFHETGYLIYRTYKVAYGNLAGAPVPLKFNEFLPDAKKIGSSVIVNEGNWQQQLEANKQAFFSEFVERSRFALAYPTWMTPVQFVDALFANAGVIPSVSEREAAIGEFSGASSSADNPARARALRRVAENPALTQQEFNRAFVLMQYFGYLRRNPNDFPDSDYTGYDFWLTKLNQFNGDFQKAEMVKAFITSGEYRKRFGP